MTTVIDRIPCRIKRNGLDRGGNLDRALTHSLDSTEEGLAVNATRTCTIDGCERRHCARGLCNRHYMAMHHRGRLDEFPPKPAPGECSIAGCHGYGNNRGLCWKHRQRVTRNGDPHLVLGLRETNGRWAGDGASYATWHKRLRAWRGPAMHQSCIDCGRRAAHWSYRGDAPGERIDAETGLRYALDEDYYDPRCVPCHAAHDRAKWGR